MSEHQARSIPYFQGKGRFVKQSEKFLENRGRSTDLAITAAFSPQNCPAVQWWEPDAKLRNSTNAICGVARHSQQHPIAVGWQG